MNNVLALALLAVTIALSGAPGGRPEARTESRLDSGIQPRALCLTHLTLIDVAAGVARPEMTIVITGDHIASVGETGKVALPQDASVIDEAGKFVIPGLWDMHVHWYDKDYLPLFTANGIIGIREMFGESDLLSWREDIATGSLIGPRMIVASPILDGPTPMWPGSIAVANPSDGRKAVHKVKEWGADFVKVYSFLPREAYFAIAEESKAEGISFAGHVPWSVSAAEASDAGQKSIEHLSGVLLACSTAEDSLRKQVPATTPFGSHALIEAKALETYDRGKAAALLQRFIKNGTWQCPTLTVLRSNAYLDDKDFRKDERIRYMPRLVRERWERRVDSRSGLRAAENSEAARRVFPKYLEMVGAMQRAGVQILAGTDTGNPYCFPGFSLHDELELLVKAGLKPAEALRAATVNPARYLGLEGSLGTIENGKIANLVVLDANPLEDIKNTRKIDGVILSGRVFDRTTLDRLLTHLKDR